MNKLLIAKAFKYMKHPGSKGVTFHGSMIIDEHGIYLVHNKHVWDSAATMMAMLGLLGAWINYFLTKNKKFEYPFDVTALSDFEAGNKSDLELAKFSKTAVISFVPKSSIQAIKKSGGWNFSVGEIDVLAISPVRKAMKLLGEYGYELEDVKSK